MSQAVEPLAEDRLARRAAQSVFDRPLVLEAGAGTGKTATLIARMLAWMLGAGWEEVSTATGGDRDGHRDGDGEPLEPERVAARVLDGVVAITFTEAAAAEMALRLGQRLSELARTGETTSPGFDVTLLQPAPVTGDELAARARALLGGLERVTISTIHAFCNSLLRRHVLSLGLHPDFRIDASEDLSEEVAREVVERATRRAYAGGGATPILELAARGIDSRQLVEAAARFTAEGTPAGTFAEPSFSPRRIAAVRADLHARAERLLAAADGRLLQVTRTDFPARIHAALEATVAALDSPAADEAPDAPESAVAEFVDLVERLDEIWESKLLDRLGQWRKGRFTRGESAAFEDLAPEIGAASGEIAQLVAHLTSLDPVLVEHGRRAIHPILVEMESLLRARGIATFQSLLVETRRLLAGRGARRRERRRIRQLLVDEFQDTDETQCEIVERLALSGPDDERPGLFVVGDPKQSIYAWRNADLAAYEGFVDRALAAGGERHRLVRNFRSAPAILAEVERGISEVMVEERGRQPAFEPLLPGRGDDQPEGFSTGSASPASPVEYWVSWDREKLERGSTNMRRAVEIEARAVAEDIRRLHEEHGEPWNEFALLLRTTSRLDDFLEAFRAAGIPFAVTGDRQYYRRREVIDAAALVRAVVHPLDHVALVAFLRSPTVGVPDAAWLPLWKRRFPALVSELGGSGESERLAALDEAITAAASETPVSAEAGVSPGPEGWPDGLRWAVRSLAALRHDFRRLPVDRFIERLRSRVLLEATEAARYLGVYRVANLERFFRRLESGLAGGHGEIDALLRALRRSVAEAREDEEALPKEAAADAVQVMTIHKAKGLEFGHVYLPQLHARGRWSEHDRNDADRRPIVGDDDGAREFVLFNRPSLGWDRVEAGRVASAAAEQVRTLYVAMTRAQKRLVLIGNWSRSPRPLSGAGVPAPLKLLQHRAPFQPSLAPLAQAIEDPAAGHQDEFGVCWKIPDLAAADVNDGATDGDPSAAILAPPARQVEAWARELRADRDAARERMRRPLFAAASDHAAELERRDRGAGLLDRPTALAVGKVVHRALEEWDLEAEPDAEWRHRLEQALAVIETEVDGPVESRPAKVERAGDWCRELFDRLRHGELLGRLHQAAPAIIARELPVLVARQEDDDPVVGVSGTVDLLLRDDRDGELVVVDYKTDEIEGEEEVRARAAAYAPQLAVYTRAVKAALGLERRPRAELWFLWPGVAYPIAAEKKA